LGGLGFFKLDEFLAAQRCMWIFRAKKFCIDNWRYDLHKAAPGTDPLLLKKCDLSKDDNPILYGIVADYENFYNCYSNFGFNYKKALIFQNTNFVQTDNRARLLYAQFFGENFYRENKLKIRKLRFSDCFSGDSSKELAVWQEEGLPLSLTTWLRLRNAILFAKHKFENPNRVAAPDPDRDAAPDPNLNPNLKCEEIQQFCNRVSKGSRRIRQFFTLFREKGLEVETLPSMTTFKQLINCNPTSHKRLGEWLAVWSLNGIPNAIRTFIFNCRANYLPLNNRLHACRPEIDPRCTFCRIKNQATAARDSFLHCFLTCETVNKILRDF
jgi:hypothetical protein